MTMTRMVETDMPEPRLEPGEPEARKYGCCCPLQTRLTGNSKHKARTFVTDWNCPIHGAEALFGTDMTTQIPLGRDMANKC
jgi:hypothetical protein